MATPRALMRPITFLWSVAVAELIAVGVYALLVEPDRLALSVIRVADPRVASRRRLLLLSDLHLRPWSYRIYHRIARAARWAMAQGADVALIAGDLLEDDREADIVAARLRLELGPLRALYVTGNHEAERTHAPLYRSNDRERVAAAMERAGIERIDDRAVDLGDLTVVGVGWPGKVVGAPPAVRELVNALPRPAIVMAHSPDHVRGLEPDRVLLAVCGHTHGGQVRLPIIGAPWIPVRAPLPRFAGYMHLDGVRTYVSRGIGATVPVRLGSVPEATLVDVAPLRPTNERRA